MNGAQGQKLALEDQLILLCCRGEPGPAESNALAELTRGRLDWEYIRIASLRHGVAPLVSRALEHAAAEGGVPAEPRADLARLYRISAARHRRLYAAVQGVVEAFAGGGVEVLALKDVGLALTAYPEPGLRPIGDVDLLIHREAYDRAAECLRRLGFVGLPGGDAPYLLKYGLGQHFRRRSDELWIDLQWNVAQREWDLYGEGTFTYDPELLWRGAVSVDAGGFELRVPAPEEMLFHLCLHLEGHEYGELILFCDIAELLRTAAATLDWSRLIERVRETHSESSVYHALLLTERLLAAKVPADVLGALEVPYFRGSLVGPLFGNLASLHESLDEIRLASEPPPTMLGRVEELVRQQAAQAMRAYSEVDALSTSFLSAGGRFIAFDGRHPERILPTPFLPAFGPLDAFVLEDDRALLGEALQAAGFAPAGASGLLTKRCRLRSRDPAIRREAALSIEVETNDDCRSAAASAPAPEQFKRRAAMHVLRAHLRGQHWSGSEAVLPLRLHVLSPAATTVVLSERIAGRSHGRLFALPDLLRILRLQPPRGTSELADAARRCETPAALGVLGLAAALLPASEAPLVPADISPPRLLGRARAGATGSADAAATRRAYLYLFSALACDWDGRRRFLRRSFARPPGRPRPIGTFARDVAAMARGRLRRSRPAQRDSFWAEEM